MRYFQIKQKYSVLFQTAMILWLSFLSIVATANEKRAANTNKNTLQTTTTHHQIEINGNMIQYKAIAGYLILKNSKGQDQAKVFFVAYFKKGVKDISKRPITFAFNGGPGAASVWLHLGALGPKRILLTDKGESLPPPYKLVNNNYSWLDLSDLVFIDPVSTGYSRAMTGVNPKQFHGYQNDINWVGEFIRLYITQNARWGSPIYLSGESYGTTRAAGLADHLMNRYGIYSNGIILISPILDFQTMWNTPGNDLPYIVFLPTYTAAAWYHKKLSKKMMTDFNKTITKVKQFAVNDYAIALLKGTSLGKNEIKRVAKKLAQFTGLSSYYARQSQLRIRSSLFRKKILSGQFIGRFDSRYTSYDYDKTIAWPEFDPSFTQVAGVFSTGFNDYIRRQLNYKNDLVYETLTTKVFPWSFANNSYLNVATSLGRAMRKNNHMRVWLACGYYDLATPFFGIEYTINHLTINRKLKKNIVTTYYQAGHMMYLHKESLIKLKKDAQDFYRGIPMVF